MSAEIEFYQDLEEMWRWRVQSANGRYTGNSGEGYHNLEDCKEGLKIVQSADVHKAVFITADQPSQPDTE